MTHYRNVDDIDNVLAFWVRADAVPRPTDHPEALAKRLDRDDGLFVLACDGRKVVGSLMCGWDGWRGNMYWLAVDPEYRRMGLARRLIEAGESRLRQMGAERVTSLVFKNEPGAVQVWESAGYTLDPTIDRYAKNLETGEP